MQLATLACMPLRRHAFQTSCKKLNISLLPNANSISKPATALITTEDNPTRVILVHSLFPLLRLGHLDSEYCHNSALTHSLAHTNLWFMMPINCSMLSLVTGRHEVSGIHACCHLSGTVTACSDSVWYPSVLQVHILGLAQTFVTGQAQRD